MLDTSYIETEDTLFDGYVTPSFQRKKSAHTVEALKNINYLPHFSRHHHRTLLLTDHYRRENALFRKPCPTCQTLVKPSLQQQHDDAYHPFVVT